jgi:predicted benzoate:H+ symporter BenE
VAALFEPFGSAALAIAALAAAPKPIARPPNLEEDPARHHFGAWNAVLRRLFEAEALVILAACC